MNMKFLTLWIPIALAPFGVLAQSKVELDIKQAQLNERMQALDGISGSFGAYVVVRDNLLNGEKGFHTQAKAWFNQATAWLQAWDQVVVDLQGDRLAQTEVQAASFAAIDRQLSELRRLLERQRAANAQGQEALRQLQAIPRQPSRNLGEFAPNLEAFFRQVDRLEAETRQSISVFGEGTLPMLEAFSRRIEDLVRLKIARLALRFPELEATVREIEVTLNTIKVIDQAVTRIIDQDLLVQEAFSSGQVYKARQLLADLRQAAAAAVSSIQQQAFLPPAVKENGLLRINRIVEAREATIKSQLGFQSEKLRFAAYYRRELTGLVGPQLVRRCQSIPAPKELDCALLRTITGFTQTNLLSLDDGQLAYIEQTIDRVKQGPLAPRGGAQP